MQMHAVLAERGSIHLAKEVDILCNASRSFHSSSIRKKPFLCRSEGINNTFISVVFYEALASRQLALLSNKDWKQLTRPKVQKSKGKEFNFALTCWCAKQKQKKMKKRWKKRKKKSNLVWMKLIHSCFLTWVIRSISNCWEMKFWLCVTVFVLQLYKQSCYLSICLFTSFYYYI